MRYFMCLCSCFEDDLLRYEKNIKLAGLIYLHRITDNRMAGSPHRNLRMFGELCGDQAAKKVVLVTTMWDKVQQDTGARREKELLQNYWKTMITYGASTARFSNSADSAWKIIDPILSLKQPAAELLLLQELVDLKRPLNETKAGKALYSDKQKLLAEHRDAVRCLAEKAREESNLQLAQQLEAELKRAQKEFDETFNERKELKIHRRLSAAYRRWQGGLTKPAMTDDLSPDDIIIACVISRSYFFHIQVEYIFVASWAQRVLGKALYVPSLYFPKGYFNLTSVSIVHKFHHRI